MTTETGAEASSYPPGFARRAVVRLSTIEMWERYSFFTLFAMLALYATAPTATGGLGWEKAATLRFFGVYLVVVQLAPLIGGWAVDRWIPAARALTLGALLLLAGHLLMAAPALIRLAAPAAAPAGVEMADWSPAGLNGDALTAYRAVSASFYGAILLIALGNGLFKPVLTVIVGRLPHVDRLARDRAFSTYFVFLNIGGLLSLVLGGWLSSRFGWSAVFVGAAAGMGIACISTALNRRTYIDPFAGRVAEQPGEAVGPVAARWRSGVALVLAIFMVATVFTYQSYGFVSLFTETYVDRRIASFTVPTPWFTTLNPLTIMALSPAFAVLAARGRLGGDRTGVPRLALTFVLMAAAFGLLAAVVPRPGTLAPATALCLALILLACSELASTPVFNALLTRLAPPRFQTLAVGASSAAVALGAWASGQVGAAMIGGDTRWSLGALAVAAAFVAILLAGASRWLRRLGL